MAPPPEPQPPTATPPGPDNKSVPSPPPRPASPALLLLGRRSPSPWSTPILLRGQRPPSLRPARSFPAADGPPAPWPARSLLAAACPSSMDGLHRLPELVEVVPFIPDLQVQVTNDATKRKIWDLETDSCVDTVQGHAKGLSALCWHPELRVLITGSVDGTVRV
ncbi:vegetative cell wall protein gp1-like [Triticum dicoccoides]|uniref:vegetative cell wall protein gp1-like n=1 Tax=Triticum dicoccoides TaxID=85692 RepID=UPI00188F38A5|nr:vegetative cell wall protein gp1-like [Triticum dicoccoides]